MDVALKVFNIFGPKQPAPRTAQTSETASGTNIVVTNSSKVTINELFENHQQHAARFDYIETVISGIIIVLTIAILIGVVWCA